MIDVMAKAKMRDVTGEDAPILRYEFTEDDNVKEYWFELENAAKYYVYRRAFHAENHWVVTHGWPLIETTDKSDFYKPFSGMAR